MFTGEALRWQGIYYHFNAWSKQDAWKNLWLSSLHLHRRSFSLSSVQLDGSHTLAKNGGAAIGYQGRKAGRTTNALFLADNQGLPLAVAPPKPATSTTRSSWDASLPSCARCSKRPSCT